MARETQGPGNALLPACVFTQRPNEKEQRASKTFLQESLVPGTGLILRNRLATGLRGRGRRLSPPTGGGVGQLRTQGSSRVCGPAIYLVVPDAAARGHPKDAGARIPPRPPRRQPNENVPVKTPPRNCHSAPRKPSTKHRDIWAKRTLWPLLLQGSQKLSKLPGTGAGGHRKGESRPRRNRTPAQGPRRSLWTQTKNSESLLPRGGGRGEGRREVYLSVLYFGILRPSFLHFTGWVLGGPRTALGPRVRRDGGKPAAVGDPGGGGGTTWHTNRSRHAGQGARSCVRPHGAWLS